MSHEQVLAGRRVRTELSAATEGDGAEWSSLLTQHSDPDEVVVEHDEYERRAPVGIRFAQALHHGSDHRSQICTALTTIGVEPPGIDVWAFGEQNGRVVEKVPG